MKLLQKAVIGSGLLLVSAHAAALSVSPTNSGETLLNRIAGSGISIDSSSVNYVGTSDQAGLFDDGFSSGLGIDSGAMLTTGLASNALGPNQFTDASTALNTSGDATLNTFTETGTADANVLDFNFTSGSGNLFLTYIFASEDYNESIANPSFSDIFAFLVDGINIATIGGERVSASTVNCGAGGTGVGVNCDAFNDNDSAPFLDLEYDGFTDAFTASVTGLGGGVHNLKLAIADNGDNLADSAIFIKEGSLTDGAPPTPPPSIEVPEPGSLALLGLGLLGLSLRRRIR